MSKVVTGGKRVKYNYFQIAFQDRLLKKLSEPSKRHLESMNRILTDIYDQYGLSDQDLHERQVTTNFIQVFLSESIPGN